MRATFDRLGRWFGTGLMIFGIAILLGTGVMYGYGQYEEARVSQEAALIVPDTPVPVAQARAPAPASTPVARPATVLASSGSKATIDPLPQPTATVPIQVGAVAPAPSATPIYAAERILAPSIGLDSKVVESPIINGEWTVPKFVAGHLQGTAEPLQGGNVVLSGHVESISSGNVFANLDKLKPGDKIQLYTRATIVTYVVDKSMIVKNNDMSVVAPRPKETLTLITCTGNWLPLQGDYNDRLVVVAHPVA